ncbi:MAG: hypothetical protein HC798_03420, partial [Polaribacter sp.]|nr:hypothetical protein [Polaribacter sp.]
IGQTGEKSFRFILMKTKSKNHKADLVEDYVKIQELALQKKQEESINKWARDKNKKTPILKYLLHITVAILKRIGKKKLINKCLT